MGARFRWATAISAAALALGIAPSTAAAADGCPAPDDDWREAAPEAMGMDAGKLQEALDYATTNAGFAVRVYRHGCLVGADRLEAVNDDSAFESYSMSKSVTSLLFGRAMTLGLISPDDPVGALVPAADRAHGEITMLDLLTMSSGLQWNLFRDYNIFTTPDRVHDALTLPVVREPGTWFEYAQSAVALLVKAVERATGEDPEQFIQRELFNDIGIPAGRWEWQRDPAGNIQGFYGVRMRVDDYARLGELLRRGGRWNGDRLLSREYLTRATSPSATNGCYGWLIWVNAGAPCIGATVVDRPVSEDREYPGLPTDIYDFSGLFGQLVAVFPSQDLVVVRTGQDPGLLPVGPAWREGLFQRVLAAVTDQKVPSTGPAEPAHEEPDTDHGFLSSLLAPEEFAGGSRQDPLPPAGPARARAPMLELADLDLKRRLLVVRLACPERWPSAGMNRCVGAALFGGSAEAFVYGERRYSVPAGSATRIRFRLTGDAIRHLRQPRRGGLAVSATNRDRGGGSRVQLLLTRAALR